MRIVFDKKFHNVYTGVACLLATCSAPVLGPVDGGEQPREEAWLGDGGSGDGGDVCPDAGQDGQPADGGCPATAIQLLDRGQLGVGMDSGTVTLDACTQDAWTVVAPRGMKVAIRLRALGSHVLLGSVSYPDRPAWQEELLSLSATPTAEGLATFSSPRSGEFLLLVRSMGNDQPSRYWLGLECRENCWLRCTRYPILLVHGWTGFKNIGPIEYFYNVPDTLASLGYLTYVAVLDPYNSVEVRSGQLAEQIDHFLVESYSRRLNLIAHSQGGLDARRAIAALGFGDRVDALVTIATPHHGTPLADVVLGLLPGPAEEALAFLLNLIGAAGGHESDALASFASMTTAYLEGEFNPQHPDDQRVEYISWTGLTCPLGLTCGDICDVEIRWSYDLIFLHAGDNDGIVPVASGQWGDYRGTIPADHFDEVGQVAGITGPNFDHIQFYNQVVASLFERGH